MIRNRSIPKATVIPELAYADVGAAADWLCRAFGFRVRIRIGDHRIQLVYGDGALVAIELPKDHRGSMPESHAILMRVDDADRHHERAKRAGATIVRPPTDFPYGERQYGALDIGGHRWTFSQSIADADPASWGGTAVDLAD